MKKLYIIITLFAFMLNAFSAAAVHACGMSNNCGMNNQTSQIIKLNDDSSGDKSTGQMHCMKCSCQHNCGSSFIAKPNNASFVASSEESYSWENILSYPQLYHIPSKPPKV